MAEIVGPAAAIVALINVIGKAAFMGHGYREKVKGASEQIKRLVDELDSLKLVLISLQNHIEQDPDSLQTLRRLGPRLTRCEEDVQLLIKKLEKPQSRWRWFFRRLKWPLDEADTQQTIKGLDRLKNTFALALNADHISIARRIERNTKGIHNSGRMEQRRVVLGWIYARHFYKKHRKIKGRRHPHTGLWILRDIEFMKWFSDTDFQILWGHGIPGVGKTFLSSVVIDHIEEHPQLKASRYGLAYIYFDFKEQDQQTPILVLASLVKQLASQIQSLPAEVEDVYHRLEPMGRTPSFDDLYGMLLATKNAFSRVYLIFDALDECVQEDQREEILFLCHRMAGDGMKLFVTSRPHTPNIQDSFKYVAKIKLEAEKEDIESYVKQKINENLTSIRFVSRVKNNVISDLVKCSRGIFLLARFNVEYICQQTSVENILDAVDWVRGSWSKSRPLNAAYEGFMKRIQRLEQTRTDVALKVLTLIVTARRPLTVIELQNEVFADPRLRRIGVLDERTLLDVCANLVFIDDTTRKHVRLIHYSAHEYLLEYPLLKIASSNIAPSNISSPNTTPYNTGLPDITPVRITPQPQGYRTFRPGVQEYYNNSEFDAFDDSDLETETTHDSGIEIPDSPIFSFSHVNINADRVREDDETTVTTDIVYNQMIECEEAKNRADENLRKHREHLHRKITKKLKNAELPDGADPTDASSHLKSFLREKARESKEGDRQRRERETREKEQQEREQKAREKERQAREREAKEKERQEREQKEKEKERQERDRKIREREQQERDRLARQNERQARERDAKEKERQEREKKEKERQERERKAREVEQQLRDRAAQMRERVAMERERQERERQAREKERHEREQEARENVRLVRELEARERARQEREQEARENVRLVKELEARERARREREQEERENVRLVRDLEARERVRREREREERENERRAREQEKKVQDNAKKARKIQKKRGSRG